MFRMKLWAAISAFSLLLLGGGLGVMVDRYLLPPPIPFHHHMALDQEMRAKIEQRLASRLDLSDEQRSKLHTIVDHHMPQLRAIFEQCRPRIRKEKLEMAQEISTMLTPAQQEKFNQLMERFKKHAAHQPPFLH